MEVDLYGNYNKIIMKEDLKEIFKNVNDWLKFVEIKNVMLLVFNSVFFVGVFKVFVDDDSFKNLLIFVGLYYYYVFLILVIFLILFLLFLFIL